MLTLDTNILIYFLKGDANVAKFLKRRISEGSRFNVSAISEVELFSYPEITPEEITKIEEILKIISVLFRQYA